MLRLLLSAALVATLTTPVWSQVGPSGGGNLPFDPDDVTYQTDGRADANTTNGVGNPHSGSDHQTDGPPNNFVSAFSSDGVATASSTGFMKVSWTPVALTCESKASGHCTPVSTAVPAPMVDADYQVSARTEAGATNGHPDKDVTLVITFSGTRAPTTMGEKNVSGAAWVAIKGKRGNGEPILQKIKVRVTPAGWKVEGGPLYRTANLSHSVQWTLKPDQFVGITNIAKASSDEQDDDDTESSIEIKVRVAVLGEGSSTDDHDAGGNGDGDSGDGDSGEPGDGDSGEPGDGDSGEPGDDDGEEEEDDDGESGDDDGESGDDDGEDDDGESGDDDGEDGEDDDG